MDKKTPKDVLFPVISEKSNPQSSDEEAQAASIRDGPPPLQQMRISKTKGVGVITTLAGINFLNTMGSGILIAALPRIAKDVDLPTGLVSNLCDFFFFLLQCLFQSCLYSLLLYTVYFVSLERQC